MLPPGTANSFGRAEAEGVADRRKRTIFFVREMSSFGFGTIGLTLDNVQGISARKKQNPLRRLLVGEGIVAFAVAETKLWIDEYVVNALEPFHSTGGS